MIIIRQMFLFYGLTILYHQITLNYLNHKIIYF